MAVPGLLSKNVITVPPLTLLVSKVPVGSFTEDGVGAGGGVF